MAATASTIGAPLAADAPGDATDVDAAALAAPDEAVVAVAAGAGSALVTSAMPLGASTAAAGGIAVACSPCVTRNDSPAVSRRTRSGTPSPRTSTTPWRT